MKLLRTGIHQTIHPDRPIPDPHSQSFLVGANAASRPLSIDFSDFTSRLFLGYVRPCSNDSVSSAADLLRHVKSEPSVSSAS
jgi:hypothetical protein